MLNSLVRRNNPRQFAGLAGLAGLADQFFANEPVFAARFTAGPQVQTRFESWTPAVDVHEEEEAYVITADLPGLKKNDVQITLEDNTLTVSGERTFGQSADKDSYSSLERGYGKFSRPFSLPRHVDPTQVEAKFTDGVLTVRVPKSEAGKSRKIKIS